jgi:hypothetical protein
MLLKLTHQDKFFIIFYNYLSTKKLCQIVQIKNYNLI